MQRDLAAIRNFVDSKMSVSKGKLNNGTEIYSVTLNGVLIGGRHEATVAYTYKNNVVNTLVGIYAALLDAEIAR